ncbi:MAG: VWA domain-containing protein [Bdellovibrionales bacterium]|nr:VWA domain-containing protein [Bdellovibrionales bacterium]
MTFGNPKALLLIPVLLAIALLCNYFSLSLQRRIRRWVDPGFWHVVIPEFSESTYRRKYVFLTIGLVFLALATARPQWGEREELIESRGMDVLFLLDLSNSMLAEDTPPSRLSRARTFIRSLLGNLGDDRVGIVSFAGKAFLTVPLTNDFDYVNEMAETVDPSAMSSQGTKIGEAIDVAIRAFERSAEDTRKQSRAIVLISDGEDFGESALKSATRLKDFGAGFFTLSVGTLEGAPIPIRDDQGVLQTYKKDELQKPILSKVNRPLLAKIAQAGGGSHLELINPDDAAYQVGRALKSFTRDDVKKRMETIKIDRFQHFLILAILFLFLHLFTGYKKANLPGLGLLVLAFLPGFQSRAESIGSYWQSRKGAEQYRAGKYDESSQSYSKALETDPDHAILSFNEGTALAQTENKEAAAERLRTATKKALSLGDFETAAKALYNEGVLHQQNQSLKDSFDRLTKSIELAKRSGLKDLEERARRALATSFDQQQKQKKDSKEQKDGDSKGDEKENPSSAEKQSPKSPEEESGRKRQFRGKTLSKDVAESLMNDLADREKQLVQRRLGGRKPKEVTDGKDW